MADRDVELVVPNPMRQQPPTTFESGRQRTPVTMESEAFRSRRAFLQFVLLAFSPLSIPVAICFSSRYRQEMEMGSANV